MPDERSRGALAGIRVIECAEGVSGPFCGKAFADLARARERDLPVAAAAHQTGSISKSGTPSADAPVLSEASESGSTENDSPCDATQGAGRELRQVADARHAALCPATTARYSSRHCCASAARPDTGTC